MTETRFPGRWLGGTALVLGPLLLLTGVLLRAGTPFFFPDQLRAYAEHPMLMTAAYSCFLAGIVLLWPAVLVLAQRIGQHRPKWALWGGAMAVFGLFARAFHAGADHLAFQLAADRGPDEATRAVADAYGAWHLMSAFSVAIMAGWIVLAIGAFRAKTFGWIRAALLASAALLPLGVLKGTTPLSVVAALGLAIALVPLGIAVLREGPVPRPRTLIGRTAGMLALIAAMALAGTLG
ncbi:hypothetical protein [Glycomyces algeriensis]|uniref:DUF4386 family protein n=1 Tax=Glycomyces algeriensis TaxID=256037 RepID=A0A9W6GC26_9ACTN|nr:hypothetical protein [Glycomyces algeriensis]MDA1365543.1 hypothetical protein [Glycomyces algeriensis]MDR7351230.1 hypothetical protein [Glycomyces algeriensis]GLI43943.1 hypothetical protein GALLR39Z86_37930 [Glycomyces algeriensis]